MRLILALTGATNPVWADWLEMSVHSSLVVLPMVEG